ncbi:ubiquinol--cytochrome-c reductase catalytic subunit rip1 [Sorochytrium milnesiophthora]
MSTLFDSATAADGEGRMAVVLELITARLDAQAPDTVRKQYAAMWVRGSLSMQQSAVDLVQQALGMWSARPMPVSLLSHLVLAVVEQCDDVAGAARALQSSLLQHLKHAIDQGEQQAATNILTAAQATLDAIQPQINAGEAPGSSSLYEGWLKSFVHKDVLGVLSAKKECAMLFAAFATLLPEATNSSVRIYRRVFLPHLVAEMPATTRPLLISFVDTLRVRMAEFGEADDADCEKLDAEILDVLKSFHAERKVPQRVFSWSIARSIYFRREFLPRLLVFRDRRRTRDVGAEGRLDRGVLESFVRALRDKGKIPDPTWREWLAGQDERRSRSPIASSQEFSASQEGGNGAVSGEATIGDLLHATPKRLLDELCDMLDDPAVEDDITLAYLADSLCLSLPLLDMPALALRPAPTTTSGHIATLPPCPHMPALVERLVGRLIPLLADLCSDVVQRTVERSHLLQQAIFVHLYDALYFDSSAEYTDAPKLGKVIARCATSNLHTVHVQVGDSGLCLASCWPFVDALAAPYIRSPISTSPLVADAVMSCAILTAASLFDLVFTTRHLGDEQDTSAASLPLELAVKALATAVLCGQLDPTPTQALLSSVYSAVPADHWFECTAYWTAGNLVTLPRLCEVLGYALVETMSASIATSAVRRLTGAPVFRSLARLPSASVKHADQPAATVSKDTLLCKKFTASSTCVMQHRRFHSSVQQSQESTTIPDFSAYKKQSQPDSDRNFSYFMIGSTGFLTAVAAKNSVHDFLTTLSASADVLALAKVEVDLSAIPDGKNVIIKWRGKPIFIRHRTTDEIQEANSVDVASLRDPQNDSDRAKKPEWLVMVGVCTHLGCVPVGESGEFGGWYCPCHGSHYDISGRIRKGPAPLNLEIPAYEFTENDTKLVIG